MPVLLLCHGDEQAKNLLRDAISARYGTNPPALEKLCIEFSGRSHIKLGPIPLWVPFEATIYLHFPTHIRTDYIVKPMGVAIQQYCESYDGNTYRHVRRNQSAEVIQDEQLIQSVRRRLWAFTAMLLTPLSEMYVRLQSSDKLSFIAQNTKLNDAVKVYLDDQHHVKSVKVASINPANGEKQSFRLDLSDKLIAVNELMLPELINAFWDDDPYFEIKPTQVIIDPDLSDSLFRLESEVEPN